jgi:hypothetical protein
LVRRCSDGEGWHVGIGGVAGGDSPGDRGVPCGEGLGGVGTEVWRGGARTARGCGWRRVGIRGVAGGSARGLEGWRRARLMWDWLVIALGKRNTKSVD